MKARKSQEWQDQMKPISFVKREDDEVWGVYVSGNCDLLAHIIICGGMIAGRTLAKPMLRPSQRFQGAYG